MTNRPSKDDLENLRESLNACLGGDVVSLKRFQDQFGEDIYNFPIKVRRIDKGKAADFYCYFFEKGRIYRRLLTYEGRCSLRTYQYHILTDLCNEWRREDKGQAFDLEPLDNHKELADIDVLIDGIPWSGIKAFLETLDPENAANHFKIGNLLLNLGDKPAAGEWFNQAMGLSPDYADLVDQLPQG